MKKLSVFLLALILSACGLGAPKQTITVNVMVSGPVGSNPNGYQESLTSASFNTVWVEKDTESKDPWGWVTSDRVKVQDAVSVTAMNERITERFLGLDPFQLTIAEGDDVEKIATFATSGVASTKEDFTGASWEITLVAAEDPYPGSGLELAGFTKEGVLIVETLPGVRSRIMLPFVDFQALVLGINPRTENPIVLETDIASCLSHEFTNPNWVATIEVSPWEANMAKVQADSLLDALKKTVSGSLTVYRFLSPDTHQECYALVAVRSAPPTSTPPPTTTALPVPVVP